MKLIEIKEDHYVVVDDSEIKEGDFMCFDGQIFEYREINTFWKNLRKDCKKITHSTQPLDIKITDEGIHLPDWSKVKAMSLRVVKELIGEVDVEKKAFEYTSASQSHRRGFIDGYNQALEDNKDRRFSEEEVIKLMYWTMNMSIGQKDSGFVHSQIRETLDNKINSLTKDTWEVEIVDGKLKLK